MLDKIIIVDFEDSFTFNIANVLYPFEKNCRVVGFKEFFQTTIYECLKNESRIGVILGPGPGHPDEYIQYLDLIKALMKNSNIYVLGICLGHQLIGKIQGYKIEKSLHQIHGQSVLVKFEGVELLVQRYNSLAVFDGENEVEICHFPEGISYQFHPESIGTEQNDIFFKKIIQFIS